MRILLCILFLFVFVAGCDSNNDFRTAASIERDLQGKWDKVRIPVTVNREIFEFSSGKFIHYTYDSLGKSSLKDTATYEIIANLTTPYISIHNLPHSATYEGRWVIIDLDSKFLTLNHQDDNTNGILSREFVKM